jgi:hypothetical protein
MGIANLVSLIGSIMVSALLDKWKKYRFAFIILTIASIIVHISLTVLLEVTTGYGYLILYILVPLVSVLILPIFTCSMDYVCELTYPVGESITGGLIMTTSQISGVLLVLIVVITIDPAM